MTRMKLLLGWILLVVLSAATPAATSGESFSTQGAIVDGAQTDDGIWIHLHQVDSRFLIAAQNNDLPAASRLIQRSSDSGNSIFVTYTLAGAHIDPETEQPAYYVTSIALEDQTVRFTTPPASTEQPSTPRETAEAALARGVALSGHGDPSSAIKAFDVALEGDYLSPRLFLLTLRVAAWPELTWGSMGSMQGLSGTHCWSRL
jgi:hypothetical protein